jgi:gentisate 1,2-dioxygenase
MSCYLQALRAGQHTKARRQTNSTVFFTIRGSGHSIIEGQRYDWTDRDIIVVPSWAWAEHVVDPGQEALFFRYTDLPVLEPFGLSREEPYRPNDGHQPLRS